mmetsp:Transcript_23938/g.65234  ORF Transcript_23938/g.65234 Transcript_23938/m.65234 type:complete len:381 (-) Transcript_23938:47-1189(-)
MTSNDVVNKIFALCVSMYSLIGVGWLVYWYTLKRSAAPSGFVKVYRVGLLCCSWSSTSVGMHVLNKVLMGNLHAPAVVSAAQMLLALLITGPVFCGEVVKLEGKVLGYWMVVPIFFSAMLCTSCYTYQYISLSLLTVVRNLTPLVVLPIERLVMPPEKQPLITPFVIMALGVMIAGTIAYVGQVQHFSVTGIIFAVTNMILASSDRLIQRYLLTGPCKSMPSGACTIVNNSFGMIPTIVVALASHQVARLHENAQHGAGWSDPRVLVLLVLSGVVGIGICYLGFETQREISATSFFVLQNVSKVAVVGAGVLLFEDPIQSPGSGIGLLLSLGGSFAYGRLQMAPPPAESKPLLKKDDPTDAPEAQSPYDSVKAGRMAKGP